MLFKRRPVCLRLCAFIFVFAGLVVALIYIDALILPWRYSLRRHAQPFTTSTDVQSYGIGAPSTATDTDSMDYINPLPILDFKDLGRKRKKLLLLIIVSTAPERRERRRGIRETWWKHCQTNSQVKCVFITDGFIVDNAERQLIIQERNIYRDMELQPLLGWEFGLRFLRQIKWAQAKFDFQFLLRIDDDYFLCLKRLLAELPTRPKENLIWGWFHCEAGVTWIDESFMIFTPDIIHKFLSQNESTMLCHPHADQQISLWLNDIPTKRFVHDSRLYHGRPASFSPQFDNVKDICDLYLGVHGTYEEKMRYFGANSNDSLKEENPLPDFSTHCKTTKFDHRVMAGPWSYEPKLCKDNPRWKTEKKMHVGREQEEKPVP